MAKPQTIRVSLSAIAQSLYDAAKLGEAKQSGVLTDAFVESPRGFDLGQLGANIVAKLESLPPDHPDRKDIDIVCMRKGVEYLVSGQVTIGSRNLGVEPVIQGEYKVEVYK